MRSFFATSFILCASFLFSQSVTDKIFQDKGEIYFKFNVLNKAEINSYTDIISIDNVQGNAVYAYANKKEFSEFLKRNTSFEVLPSPGELIVPEMSDNIEEVLDWNVYPTYDAYITMMNQFAASYPNLCTIVEAGTSIQGRKILFAKISDNISQREPEPQFMFSSSMHGDETTGYVLMLRLIDSLLTSYGTDQRITNMIDNIEIWINPLANPDGTYKSGNTTVSGAIRGNANYIDINRNFPDPQDGPHPDGNDWQPETITMMSIASQNNFTLSANFHGGTEVVNYPWDTWALLHTDNNWFMFISHLYADTCQANSPSGYMNGYNDGITNGYAWYEVNGGRQDFYTYFKHCREVTIEISDTKLLPANQLPNLWNYNRKSFLTYIENTLYGIHGLITDTSGNPVKALVKISGHDFDSSEVYSHPLTGDYHRMIAPGTYALTFSAPGFYSQTIPGITTANFQTTVLNVELVPDGTPVELTSFTAQAGSDNNILIQWTTATETNNHGFEVERRDLSGNWRTLIFIQGSGTTVQNQYYSYSDKEVSQGKYIYRLKQIDLDGSYTYSNEVEVDLKKINFYLYQNYPNPFNPVTNIKYQIQVSGHVQLKVYDIIGNEVSVLVNEPQEPGIYEVTFDAGSLSSGIYYYQIKSGSYTDTKKLILLR